MNSDKVTLHVFTSGGLEKNGAEIALRGKKSRGLLAYLALENRHKTQRSDLAELFWPGVDAKKARASVRQSFTDIRKAIGAENLLADGAIVAFNGDAVTTDLQVVADHLNAGTVNEIVHAGLRALPSLLADYEGIGAELDAWIRATRGAIVDATMGTAEALLHSHMLDPEERLRLARSLLEVDDLNETVVRGQIAALADLDDNSAALRVYNAFYERLEEELGAEPSLKTQDLAVKIKLAGSDSRPQEPEKSPRRRPVTLIAVMPFERLGPNDIPDYTILGMLDQITCRMAAVSSPGVISYNTARQFLDQPIDVMSVGVDLNAAYILTGTVRCQGDVAILSVQLCDGSNGQVIWTTNRKANLADLFDASDRLAGDILQAIEPSLNLAELERARALPWAALEPHHFVLKAKDLMFRLSQPDFLVARAELDKALALRPASSAAYALSAEWHGIDLWQGWSRDPAKTREMIEAHSQQAIALSPQNGRVLAQWGHHKITLHRDFDGAMAMFDQALEHMPNDSETLIWTVPTLAQIGQGDKALTNGKLALRLSPYDPFLHRNEHFVSLAHYLNGDFEEAVRLGLSSFEGRPQYGSNLRTTMAALVAIGRGAEARELSQHHRQAEPKFSLAEFQKRVGVRDPDIRHQYIDHLRLAGVES